MNFKKRYQVPELDWMFNNYCSINPDTSSDRFGQPNSMKLALILTQLSTEAFSDTSFRGH